MAPNKKKKKATANNSRGFATVSQPSKSKEVSTNVDEKEESKNAGDTGAELPSENRALDGADEKKLLEIEDMTPEQLEAHLEDSELQNIIDSCSVRCNQDASRQIVRLEQERRHMRSSAFKLSTAALLPDPIVDDLLSRQSEAVIGSVCVKSRSGANSLELLVRLWTLSKILSSLKFPNVHDAIEHLLLGVAPHEPAQAGDYVWGLQEVLEWYASTGQHDNLPDYEHGSAPDAGNGSISIDGAQSPETRPSNAYTQAETSVEMLPNSLVSQEESAEEDLTPIWSSNSEDEDPAFFNERYVQLQTLLFHTEHKMGHATKHTAVLADRKSRIEDRIQSLRRDILFDYDAAEEAWRQTLRELQIDVAKSVPAKETSKSGTKDTQKANEVDEDDQDMLGGMFGAGEEGSLDDCASKQDSKPIRLVDFGEWTGIKPRRLLEEICQNMNPSCKPRFSSILVNSYSSRQKVDLQWPSRLEVEMHALSALPKEVICLTTGHTVAIGMEAIAAATAAQAESYLSTIMLFLLVQSKHCDAKQSNRLPTIWRDTFTDLVQARKVFVDASEKEELRHIRKIISQSEKALHATDLYTAPVRDRENVKTYAFNRQSKQRLSFSEDEARAQWRSRKSSLAYQKILRVRQQLPVHQHKSKILQAIGEHQLTIICADTGAGKSTQVPSFVLEDRLSRGYDCKIMVTQPRRISAISLARRVSQELGENGRDLGTENSLVGYAIRLESKTSQHTRLTFATTGVLLRMIEGSPDLDELDYLVLDEVHERTMDLDLLFIALRKLQQRRANLKLILMSATVDAQKFSDYFGGAPILSIPGRTFPVEVRYLEDAIEETLDIKLKGHKTDDYSDDDEEVREPVDTAAAHLEELQTYSGKTRTKLAQMDEYRIDYQLTASLIEAIATKEPYRKYSSAILVFMPGIAEIRRFHGELLSRKSFTQNWIVHLLHSSFSTEELEQAFSEAPQGYRKIVIATNIAETGITIPDVTAVVDTCKEKVMRFDERRQLSRLTEGFISRSSARQRKGRAARVQDGLCFHLVTRYRYEHLMLEQHVPEILRLSLQDPILKIKVWNLGSIEETLASAIDPPTSRNVRKAVEKLKDAGALNNAEELTSLGQRIASLPLEVVLGKLAMFGIVFQCLDAVLTIIAALTSKSPFQSDRSGRLVDPRLAFARGDSDLVSILNAYQGWLRAKDSGVRHQFCRRHHLSDPNLSAIEDQKIQLLVYLVDARLIRLDPQERTVFSKSRTSSKRISSYKTPERFNKNEYDGVINAVVAMAFYPKILLREGRGWRNVYTNQQMTLMSSSVNRASEKPPGWLCFYEAVQAKSGTLNVVETSKVAEIALVTALGAADFRFFSGVVVLDNGRIRFSVRHWKQLAAIKALRASLLGALENCWQTPELALSALDQQWIETFTWVVSGRDSRLTQFIS